MSRKEIRDKLLRFQKEAEVQAELACTFVSGMETPGELSETDLCEIYSQYVHRYICAKFYLPASADPERLLIHLAEDSIEEAIRMKIPFARDSETATTCGAAGSAAVKVALLMVAIQKDFHIQIPPEKMAFVRNTRELGKVMFQANANLLFQP